MTAINNVAATIQVGQSAPDFSLPSHDKQTVTLSEQRGKNVVLLFFPAAFTPTCTAEMCTMRDNLTQFNDLNAQVYGISVDMPYTLKEYARQNNLNFPLLSDFNKEASMAYDTMYESFGAGLRGVSKRSAFVIDKEGIVRYAEVLENAGLEPDYGKIKEVLAGLN